MIPLIIILVYLSLLLILGVFANRMFRGTRTDYMLASHSIGPFLLLMSLFGTTMTAFALVGSTGESFKEGVGVYGLLASSSGIIHSLCFFVIGIRLWKFGRSYGYTTQIQFFRDRLENNAIGLLLFPILVGLVIPYLLIGVISGGTVLQVMTSGAFFEPFGIEGIHWFATEELSTSGGLPKWLGSFLICAVVLIYVFSGGMRGTAWANAFQTLVFMILGMVTFYVIAMKVGGQSTLMESLRTASEAIPHDKVTRADMSKTKFLTYLFVPLSVGMFPHLFQHWLTARSASSFKLPVIAHPIFIMIVWAPCVLIGAWATTELVNVPAPVAGNPNRVLPFLVKTLTNPYVGGLLTAGILAAIMSSLDSQFLCLGTIFTSDIVTHYSRKDRFTDKQQVLMARVFIVIIVAVTYVLSLFPPRSVFGMGVWCFSGFASLFPLVFAAVYWRRLTVVGAFASVITTVAVWCYFFWKSDFGANRTYTVDIAGYETMPVATIFVCSLTALIVGSLISKPPSEATLRRFFRDA